MELLAPNGKPSNLTPEQYRLVRTPAFKAWFGDWENSPETASKVVDENGEPLICYHGTASNFNVFEIGRTGGIFFTNNKNSAERFSSGDLKRQGENSKILQCFLNIRKYYDKNTNDEILIDNYYKQYFEDRPFISKSSQKNILKDKYKKYFMDLVTFGIINEEPKDKLLSYKYDGIIIDADNNSKSYIIFESTQIKLADGTNTTFDGSNPDIRFAKGGFVKDYEDKKHKVEYSITVWKNPYDSEGYPMNISAYAKIIKDGNEIIIGSLWSYLWDIDKEKKAKINASRLKVFKNIKSNGYSQLLEIEDAKVITEFQRQGIYKNLLKKVLKDKKLPVVSYKWQRNGLSDAFWKKNKDANVVNISSNYIAYPKKPDVYNNGGLILLAPNGKPSNLTPEQHRIVRTPEFKAWFGDWENAYETGNYDNVSKVIDEVTKEPLVVYIGQSEEHLGYVFELGYNLLNKPYDNNFGHFFTEDYHLAKLYSGDDYTETGYILEVFLNIRKIIDIRDLGYKITFGGELTKFLYLNYRIDFSNYEQLEDDIYNYKATKLYRYDTWDYFDVFPLLRNVFIENDFNGVVFKDNSSDRNTISYIAFNSNQIKLADGTNTTFDGNNPDIRYKKGGEVKAEDMLKKPIIIKQLNELDYDGWVEEFHAKTKNYKPNTYYHVRTYGSNAGLGKGLYLGRDKNALISFYGIDLDEIIVDTYIGNPNWLDLIYYEDYKTFEKKAIKKYGENYIEKKSLLDIDVRGEMVKKLAIYKGFDGIRYYDTFATGEEFVLFDTKKIEKIDHLKKMSGELTNPDVMNELLAPNGKPSNLTPEQYHLVRTPAFISWFGDWENSPETASKVVDSNGEPLVVYHGTNEKINVFDVKKIDIGSNTTADGFFFTTNKEYAKKFGNSYLECFLNIKNPIIIDEDGNSKILNKNYIDKIISNRIKEKNVDDDFLFDSKGFLDIIYGKTKKVQTSYGQLNYVLKYIFKNDYEDYSNSLFTETKIDGFFRQDTFICLFSNQIKLADGSNTTFDGSNPDIRFDDGGSIPDLLSIEQIENKLGRELHWWNDDIVYLSGIEYKKVYLRPEYKKVIE